LKELVFIMNNFLNLVFLVFAMLFLMAAMIARKKKKLWLFYEQGALLCAVLICINRYLELGMEFIKRDFMPIVATAAVLISIYIILTAIEKKKNSKKEMLKNESTG
jgi:uncharacterized membrane protein